MQCIEIKKLKINIKNAARNGNGPPPKKQVRKIAIASLSVLGTIITIWHGLFVPVFGKKSAPLRKPQYPSSDSISASELEKLKSEINQGELTETIFLPKNEGYKVVWVGWQSDGVATNKIWALFHKIPNSKSNNGRAIVFGKPYGKLQIEYSTGKGKSNLLLIEEKRIGGYIGLNPNQIGAKPTD